MELVYTQRTNERNAPFQRILDAADDIRNNPYNCEDVTTSNNTLCSNVQVAGRCFEQFFWCFIIK
jgi:hypothetical protein